jgi:hypothetical protein
MWDMYLSVSQVLLLKSESSFTRMALLHSVRLEPTIKKPAVVPINTSALFSPQRRQKDNINALRPFWSLPSTVYLISPTDYIADTLRLS